MLAYVFWHWKKAEIAEVEYEARQQRFHAALNMAPPVGFVKSFTAAISQAAWAAGGGNAYEDWYLIQDFTALGLLNEAAISASRAMPHDAAAAVAAGGTAGIYGLRLGKIQSRPQFALWFGKPDNMTYGELDAQLTPVVDQYQGALWTRQMTLGPAQEFCLQTEVPVTLPAAFKSYTIPLRSVWPA